MKNIVQLRQFDIHRETRIICDASHDGLGAVLEQYSASGWHPISFASRYLNPAEKKYSTNDLKLLAVVWATEHFRNYIYDRYFTVTLDHKALHKVLNSSPKGNKTFFSQLTRWYDRLVPYDFKFEHRRESKMGMADYLSRFSSAEAPETCRYDEIFIVAKIKKINAALNPKDQMKPRGQRAKHIESKTTVEGDQSRSAITKTVASNGNERTAEYAKTHRERKRSLENVFACNRRLTNQNREIGIPAEICKYRRKKIRRCSQYLKSIHEIQNMSNSNMSNKNMSNSPEKHDPLFSAIVNTSTHSGDVSLNVVLNRLNQPPSVSSVSSDSDIDLIPPEKVAQKQTNTKK